MEDAKKTSKNPLRVKITGDWEAAMGNAMSSPPPPGGWPKPDAAPQRAPKKKAAKKRPKSK